MGSQLKGPSMNEATDTEPAIGSPFVGRDRELNELDRALRGAAEGRGSIVLIGGEPGIGKTRLADQLLSQARDEGLRVLIGRCWEGAGAPAYWPWVQALRMLLRGLDDEALRQLLGTGGVDVAQIVPELRDRLPELPESKAADSESARFQLFDSAATFLRRAADAGPMVIMIDDLHAADTASVLLLRFLGSQLSDAAILVVCTYRDVELTPDAPLANAVDEIARQPTTLLLTLPGLAETLVSRFIEAATGAAPGPRLVSALARETDGNPLFLGEAVRLLAAEGRLDEAAAGQGLHLPIPRGIRDVITRRMRHMNDSTVEDLVHAAALGPEFSVDVLRQVLDSPGEELLDRLGEATRAGLIGPIPGALGRFRFSHDLIRETLYDGLSPGRRARLHLRIGEALESIYGAAPDAYLAELAHHFFEACRGGDAGGDGTHSAANLAISYAGDAGDQALSSLAYEEASRLYRMALTVLEHHPSDAPPPRLDLLLRLGDAEARGGDLPTSRETFLGAVDLARRTGDAEALARAAIGYGGGFFWARAGNDQHLIPMLQDALVMLGGRDDRLRVRLLTRLACAWRSDRERQEQRRALSQQAVDMARRLDDPATLGYALVGFFWAVWLPDNADERLAVANEMLAVAEAAQDVERTIDAHLMMYLVFIDLCRMTEARARMEMVMTLAHELRQPAQLWLTWANRASLALLEGDYALAEETMAHETDSGHPTTPVQDDVSAARMHRFLLRREQGRGSEEEASVRASVAEFPWYPVHRSALVCLLAEAGRTVEARAVFEELATDDFHALYPDCEWLLGTALASDACAMLGDQAAAAVLYSQLLPFSGGHAIGHTEGSVGSVDRYLGLLAATMGRPDDAVRHLTHGIAANERLGAWPWAAHTQHDLAGVLRRRAGAGDVQRANALDAAALATARRLGMSALEAEIGEGSALGAAPAVEAESAATFRREGEYWTIRFEDAPFRIRDMKGMRHLARLLAEPGRELHALDLAGADQSNGARSSPEIGEFTSDPFADGGPIIDPEAREAYRSRLAELREDLDEATAWNDPGRAARASSEVDALTQQLAGAVGLGGRDRVATSAAERARLSVTRAIRAALARIGEQSPALGRHLEATIHTGAFCSYIPDPRVPIRWEL
jgi:tetratricopeptide (TPR) repeat protein